MDIRDNKIGILTFHKSINYGSVLQAWALQQVLLREGYDAEIIDYEPKAYKSIYDKTLKSAAGVRSKLKVALTLSGEQKRQQHSFEIFRNNCLNLSPIQYNLNTAKEIYEQYNTIITGSDQIWNTSLRDCDPIYFLPSTYEGVKIAYACSINTGTSNDRFSKQWLRKWISDYDFVSIREQSGIKKINALLDGEKKVYQTLDPTLLLDKKYYEDLISERNITEDYIFLYNMWTKEEGIEAARILSDRTNLPVYTVTNQMDLIRIFKFAVKGVRVDLKHTSPRDFISLIMYANYVVTDSFHGTAFSIIFNKPFIVINSHIGKNKLKNDERLIAILNEFGIMQRFISLDTLKNFDSDTPIDYMTINEKRKEISNESLNLLLDAIKGKV